MKADEFRGSKVIKKEVSTPEDTGARFREYLEQNLDLKISMVEAMMMANAYALYFQNKRRAQEGGK